MTEKKRKTKIIVEINFFECSIPKEEIFVFSGYKFKLIRYQIGWDFETAKQIIANQDGYADAIVFVGLFERADVFDQYFVHQPTHKLINLVRESEVYTGSKLREFYSRWTINNIAKTQPTFFFGRKALFHTALVSPMLAPLIEHGVKFQSADLISLLGIPIPVNSLTQLKNMIRTFKVALGNLPFNFLSPSHSESSPIRSRAQMVLKKLIAKNDIFVTFRGLLDDIGSFDVLKGKVLIIDALSVDQKRRLKDFGVSDVVEIGPKIAELDKVGITSFAVFDALFDLVRQADEPDMTYDEYLLKYLENSTDIQLETKRKFLPPLRCAFIIHPLEQDNLYLSKYLRWIKSLPDFVIDGIENQLVHAPSFHYGSITGIKSTLTGQEVICEVYTLLTTPKIMRKMSEEALYKKLVKTTEQARERGCVMLGLGAYTKVIGDAGITVSKRSPIPVTNGNSYSTAATLWAAKEMSERMGFLSPICLDSPRVKGKAMVIGATGGIGRVSSHLLALVFDELVLVGRRADKLLELRDEIKKDFKDIKLSVCTDPNIHLLSTDLIVTATSNDSGKILDIMKVKPGAVICDCSRPLDIGPEDAKKRPDVMIIESGEIDLPGDLKFTCDIGLPFPSVYACLAETVLLSLENRIESFSLGRRLSLKQVKEIYKLGIKHGAKLSAIRGPMGTISNADIKRCRNLAAKKLKTWQQDTKAKGK